MLRPYELKANIKLVFWETQRTYRKRGQQSKSAVLEGPTEQIHFLGDDENDAQ